jgi:hypothetical protein
MAFAAAKFNCIAVGPNKIYTYHTADTLTTSSRSTVFNTTNCPGLAKGDIIFAVHSDASSTSQLLQFAIRDVDATYATCSVITGTAMAY